MPDTLTRCIFSNHGAPCSSNAPAGSRARRQASSAGIESASSAKMRPASASGSARASGVRPTKVTPTATPATFATPARSSPSLRARSTTPVDPLYTESRLPTVDEDTEDDTDNDTEDDTDDGKKRLATPQPARKRRLPSVDEETVPASDNEECVPDVASSSRVPAKARARSLSGASSLTSLQSTPPPSLRSTPVRKRWGEGNDVSCV